MTPYSMIHVGDNAVIITKLNGALIIGVGKIPFPPPQPASVVK